MPEPQWAESGLDIFDKPTASLEIIGRGEGARKSKTFLKDQEIATLLGFIRGHTVRLMEVFRRSHARHFTVEIEEEDPETGEITTRIVPEILTDAQVRDKYPVVAEWGRLHQEQVDHYASIGGFSVRATSGMLDEPETAKRSDSSAGADRRSKTGASKVGGTEPKWR